MAPVDQRLLASEAFRVSKSEAFSQRSVSATACFPELIFSAVRLPDLRPHCWGNEGLYREQRAELGCKSPGYQGTDVQAWSCRLQDKGLRARALEDQED